MKMLFFQFPWKTLVMYRTFSPTKQTSAPRSCFSICRRARSSRSRRSLSKSTRPCQSVADVLKTRRGSCSWGFCRKERSRPFPVSVSSCRSRSVIAISTLPVACPVRSPGSLTKLSLFLQAGGGACSLTSYLLRLAQMSGTDHIPEQVVATEPRGAEDRFAAMRLALARRRKALGMSMSELAREIGMSPSMVSQIERGQTLPSVATLFALAKALGADVDIFFGDGEDGGRPRRTQALAETRPETAVRQARERLYIVRRGERKSVDIRGGVRWERLTPRPLELVEFLELVYSPGAESSSELY